MKTKNTKIKELSKENEKLTNLLNATWFMLDHCHLDFKNGVVVSGVDEGSVNGWKEYTELEKECEPYFKEWR